MLIAQIKSTDIYQICAIGISFTKFGTLLNISYLYLCYLCHIKLFSITYKPFSIRLMYIY